MATNLSSKEVKHVLEKYFQVVPNAIQQLNGFRCLNFKIFMQNGEKNHGQEATYIMKFTDSTFHCACANLELQHKMEQHLNRKYIVTSLPVAAIAGQTIVEYIGDDGKEYKVQLLTYIKGIPLIEADLTGSEMEDLSPDLGIFVGRMHKYLIALEYDASDLDIYNEYYAENALCFRDKLMYVADEQLRLVMAKYLDLFEKNFIPRKQELRKIITHADITDGNVILRKEEKGWELAGVIDFENSHFGYLVGDLGICLAYTMMRAGSVQNCNIIEVSKRIVQSYEQQVPLTTAEREVLFEIVTSRAVVSYLTACFKSHNDPENRESLFRQSRSVPSVLRTIDEVGRSYVLAAWFHE